MPTVIKCLSHIKALYITVLLSCLSPLWAELPQPQNTYVNDFASFLTPDDSRKVDQQLKNLRQQSGIEMTIVTIRSTSDYISVEGDNSQQVEALSADLFALWSHNNPDTNKGIMILIALKERLIKIKFGQLYLFKNEAEIQKAIDLMHTDFIKGSYRHGFTEGIDNIIRIIQEGSIEGNTQANYIYILITFLSTFSVICFFAVISFLKDRQNGWGWEFFTYLFFIVFWLPRKITKNRKIPKKSL